MKRLLCAMLAVLLLCGCTPEEQISQQTIFAMDTVMDLKVWGENGREAISEIGDLIAETERLWSAADETSVLSKVNKGEATFNEEARALLEKVQALSQRTEGAFDPQLHSLISLWGFLNDEYNVPAQAQISEALSAKQWNLGAAIKGYVGQLAAEKLAQLEIDRAILNLGGNVQTYGQKPDGTPWQIGIQNPNGGDPLGTISITGTMSIVTSGDYQRYFEEAGVRYHHILDPKTGYPANSGLSSVTVICNDGMTADALSTALYVMGLEKATAFWRESSDFEAVFVLSNGEIYATQGVVLSGCECEVVGR